MKIWVISGRHCENLISLYQECYFKKIDFEAYYININNYSHFIKSVKREDCVFIIHYDFKSNYGNLLYKLSNELDCRRFVNKNSYKYLNISDKRFQQDKVRVNYDEITIPTFYLNEIKDEINDSYFPFIAKPPDGSLGVGVKLIKDSSELDKIKDNDVIQPYIKNDGDWRVVVINGKSVSAIKRIPKKDNFLNNIAQGCFAVKEIDKNILENIYNIAEIASKELEYDYVGVDVIYDLNNKKYLFLEANSLPTFETSQILTGVNISGKIIEFLVS